VLHALFYFFVIQLLGMLFVLLLSILTGNRGTVGGFVPAVGLCLVLVHIFWGLAADSDRSVARSRNLLQRFLLLHRPSHRARWVWHVFFYIALLALVAMAPIVLEEIRTKSTAEALLGTPFWVILLVASRAAAVRGERDGRTLGRAARWLLFYSPRYRWATLLHVLFWVCLVGTASILALGVSGHEFLSVEYLFELFFFLTGTVILWGMASDLEQERQRASPQGIRRALLLFVPDRRALWILHVIFYGTILVAAESALEIATGQLSMRTISTDTGEVILSTSVVVVAPLIYMLLLMLVSQHFAICLEPWGRAIQSPWTWLWPGHLPKHGPRRVAFILSAGLFYTSAALGPLFILDGIDAVRSEDAMYLWTTVLPALIIGLTTHWLARRLRKPDPNVQSTAMVTG
jgi:hypothetical protein